MENGEETMERRYGLGGYKNWNMGRALNSILRDLDTNKYKNIGQYLIEQYKKRGHLKDAL